MVSALSSQSYVSQMSVTHLSAFRPYPWVVGLCESSDLAPKLTAECDSLSLVHRAQFPPPCNWEAALIEHVSDELGGSFVPELS